MLRVTTLRRAEEFQAHHDDWNALVAGSPDGSFFETSEWIAGWLESYWKPGAIEFLLVHDGSRLVGAAPLLVDEHGTVGCRGTLTLPRNSQVPHASVFAAASRRAAVLDAVFAQVAAERRVVRVVLTGIERDSGAWYDTHAAVERHQLSWLPWEASRIPRVRITTDWDAYLKTRNSHVRSELKRKLRNLEKAGRLEWVVATTPAECEAAMPDVFRIEEKSWKQATGTSFALEPGTGPFYDALARRAAAKGWLRLYIAYLDGAPLAHMFGVVFKNEYLALKTSYDESARDLSPGIALAAYALRDAFTQRYEAFDFLGVQARWKEELATEVRLWSNACVFSGFALRCHACRTYETAVKPFVREHFEPVLKVRRRLKGA